MQSWQILAASKSITLYSSEEENTSNPLYDYNPHRGIVNCAVYNHTNKVIASCGQDSKISLHSASSPKDRLAEITYNSISEEPASVNCCIFSPKSKFIAAGSVNSTVKIWDMKHIKEREPMKKLKGHVGAVTSLAWVNQQKIIASSSTSGDVYFHDVMTGAIRETFNSKMQEGINMVRVSEGENFSRLAACTNSGSIMVWDLNSSGKKPIYSHEDPKKASVTGISISAYKPVLMAASSLDSTLTFLDIQQKKIIKTVATEEPLTAVAFHINGQTIAVGGMNGGLHIYDLRKLSSSMIKLNGHDTPIKSVCFADKIDKEREKSSSDYYQNKGGSTKLIKEAPVKNYAEVKTSKEPYNPPKSLTPVSSIAKFQQDQQQMKPQPRAIRNLAKREETVIPQQSKTVQNFAYNRGNNITQTNNSLGSPEKMRGLEEKMMEQNQELRMEMNERFDGLHLEIIRQMQNLLREIGDKLESSNERTRELEARVRNLQAENEDLRKRTY